MEKKESYIKKRISTQEILKLRRNKEAEIQSQNNIFQKSDEKFEAKRQKINDYINVQEGETMELEELRAKTNVGFTPLDPQQAYVVDGNVRLTAQEVFETNDYAVAIASKYVSSGLHKLMGASEFTELARDFITMLGSRVNLSVSSVVAASSHIVNEELNPTMTFVFAKGAIINDSFRKSTATAVTTGTGSIMFDIKDKEFISSSSNEFSATYLRDIRTSVVVQGESKQTIMETTLASIYKSNTDPEAAQVFAVDLVDDFRLPDFQGKFPTSVGYPGLMSPIPVPSGPVGLAALASGFLTKYGAEHDVLYVSGYNAMSTADVSKAVNIVDKIVPFPALKDAANYSMALYSTVSEYNEGMLYAAELERLRKTLGKDDKKESSVRGELHSAYGDAYEQLRQQPYGTTPNGLKYYTLYSHKMMTADAVSVAHAQRKLDGYLFFMKIEEYYTFKLRGIKGFGAVVLDMPTSVALVMSKELYPLFNKRYVGENGILLAVAGSGYWVLPDLGAVGVKVYSDFMMQFMTAHLLSAVHMYDRDIFRMVMARIKEERCQGSSAAKWINILDAMTNVYSGIECPKERVIYTVPSYGALKAMKYTRDYAYIEEEAEGNGLDDLDPEDDNYIEDDDYYGDEITVVWEVFGGTSTGDVDAPTNVHDDSGVVNKDDEVT